MLKCIIFLEKTSFNYVMFLLNISIKSINDHKQLTGRKNAVSVISDIV